MDRAQIWKSVKQLAEELQVDLRYKYPRITTEQANNELSRLKGIEFFRKAEEGKKVSITTSLRPFLESVKVDRDHYAVVTFDNKRSTIIRDEDVDEHIAKLQELIADEGGFGGGGYTAAGGSDLGSNLDFDPIESIDIEWHKIRKERKEGAYFSHYHNLKKIDLSRYQIFRKEKEAKYDLNCLEHALLISGINKDDFERVKTMIRSRTIPKKDIKIIAQELDLTIILKYYKNVKTEIVKYGKGKTVVNIGLLDKHYFLNEETNYTRFSIVNYFDIKHLPDFNKIYTKETLKTGKIKYKRKDVRIDSFELIKTLLLHKETHLSPITVINSNKLNTFKLREYDELPEKVFGKKIWNAKNSEDYSEYDIIYFDTETTTDGDIHKPYMLCSENRNGERHIFTGDYCIINWLKSLKNYSVCFAHNLRYDFQFVLKYVTVENMIKTGNKIKSVSVLYKGLRLVFKDTYGLISMPLRDFGRTFKLEQEKEVMPYELYTEASVKERLIKIESAKQYLSDADYKQFVENINRLNLADGEDFYHIRYAAYYCKRDVSVLKAGYETFRRWMDEIAGIDIDYCVSLPQLANQFGIKSGVYDGCYQITGVARDFIQRTVVGGRCMVRRNEKIIKEKRIEDYDGVSLYPSAMNRIPGFLKGLPKLYNESVDLSKVDGYFLEIDVLDIKKNRDFPLISRKNEGGIRMFDNNIRGRIYVDKFMLEDLIKYQQIEYKIIRGYYFDEGRNERINEFIRGLFEERKKKKKEKNPIEVVYKLLMNSFYGKTILKPIEYKYTFVRKAEKLRDYISYHFNHVEGYVKIDEEYYMIKEHKPIIKHYNACHIGSEILSVSKRIMNEVMCLAEDIGVSIYYQDTDSMHIRNDKGQLDKLKKAYYEQFGRELDGTDLGQFHCDFNVDNPTITPHSVRSVFLGKKSYYDKVFGGQDYTDVYRMKGIPGSIMTDIENTYNKLYNGEAMTFDLTSVCKFKSEANFTTTNLLDFKRTVRF